MFKTILKSVGLMTINYHQKILKDAILDSEVEACNLMVKNLTLEKTVMELEKAIAESQSVSKQAVKSTSKYSDPGDYND